MDMTEVSCDTDRNGGAVPRRQRCVSTQRRNLIISGTFNQTCHGEVESRVLTSEDRLAENANRAVAFRTDWCRSRSDPEIPASTVLFADDETDEYTGSVSVRPWTVNVARSVADKVLQNRLYW